MFFMDYNNNPPGGYGMSDLWLARRDRNTDAFGLPVPFTNPIRLRPPVNSAAWDCQPEISRDWPAAGSKLYFNRGVFMEDHEIFEATWYPGVPFRRADANDDGSVDIADAVFTLVYLFVDSSSSTCLDAADANDDGAVDIADPVSTLNYLFRGGTPPAEPFGACGIDVTVEEMSCESFQSCQ
jgi:hypothetical protein